MIEKLKTWYAANQKLAMYVGIGVVVVYFGWKYLKKRSHASKLTTKRA